MSSGIYRIDLGNGWFYIGSSVDLSKRKAEHIRELRRGKHKNFRMQRCWNKYQTFEFSVLLFCQKSEILLQEQLLIDAHFSNPKNTNISPTAGTTLGYRHSPSVRASFSNRVIPIETRKKISETLKGNVLSAKTRAKISAASKGKPKSAQHSANISAGLKGKPKSAEHSAKMGAAHKGKIVSAETRAKISAANKGRIISAETRAKIGAAHKGKIVSAETRAKLSIAGKNYRQKLREKGK